MSTTWALLGSTFRGFTCTLVAHVLHICFYGRLGWHSEAESLKSDIFAPCFGCYNQGKNKCLHNTSLFLYHITFSTNLRQSCTQNTSPDIQHTCPNTSPLTNKNKYIYIYIYILVYIAIYVEHLEQLFVGIECTWEVLVECKIFLYGPIWAHMGPYGSIS